MRNLPVIVLCPALSWLAVYYSLYRMHGDPLLPALAAGFDFVVFIIAAQSARRKRKPSESRLPVTAAAIISALSLVFALAVLLPLLNGAATGSGRPVEFIRACAASIHFGQYHVRSRVAVPLLWAAVALAVLMPGAASRRTARKVRRLTRRGMEMTPAEFLNLKYRRPGKKSEVAKLDCPGVYVLYNKTQNRYYVGQGRRVMQRVGQHFTGHGNGDVYADWKYGNEFSIRIVRLKGSGFSTLNSLERSTIAAYNAFSNGYNKTRGNQG